MAAESDIIEVSILGEQMQLRGGDHPEVVRRAANKVKEISESLAEKAPKAPALQVIILAAINLADELYQAENCQRLMESAVQKANEIIAKAEAV
jgi:cell division protein ZapA (FtsZ GTPase activity inhibitor)